MADAKISALPASTTPLAGTEVVPLVQSGTTKKVSVENILTSVQPSGNANGIVYLNGSKQASTSASFFYDGSNLGINTSSVVAIYGKTTQFGNGTSNNTLYLVGSSGSGFIANAGSVFNITGRGSTTMSLGTNDVERIAIDLSGNTTLSTGNLVIGTSNKGVNFTANTPAAGMTSQLLNWYEEGTWTPSQGSGLTVVGAFSSSGSYTRIGRQVTVRGTLSAATSVAVASGALTITNNLPFASSGAYSSNMFNASLNQSSGIAVSANIVYSVEAMAATPSITFSATYAI